MALEIGFFLVLLDVQSIGLGPNFPIDVAQVIARSVLAMGREFDRETVVGAAMLAGDKPFDD